jgi:myosin heavy subunit
VALALGAAVRLPPAPLEAADNKTEDEKGKENKDGKETGTDKGKRGGRRRGGAAAATVGAQFKTQLCSLMDSIAATETHYVRCVNPNSRKAPRKLEQARLVDQLRSSGVMP